MKKLVVSMFLMVAASFFIVCGVSAASISYSSAYRDIRPYRAGQSVTVESSIDVTISDVVAGHRYYFICNPSSFTFHHYDANGDATQYGTVEWRFATLNAQSKTASVYCSIDNENRVYFVSDFDQNSVVVTVSFSITITDRSTASAVLDSVYCTATYGYWCSSLGDDGPVDTAYLSILEQLKQISDDQSLRDKPRFLGDDALVYFDGTYFNKINAYGGSGSVSVNEDTGQVTMNNAYALYFESNGNEPVIFLQEGRYYAVCNVSSTSSHYTFFLSGANSSEYPDQYETSGHYFEWGNRFLVITIDVKVPIATSSIIIGGGRGETYSGLFYGGIVRASLDDVMSSAVNPDQSGLIDDVDNAGQQQAQQEEQLWTNINSYKGDLTFNLDDWSEAAGGLSYVSGIFMQIWNNSPTQIIILSLMLGIAMLSIGRGVHAAVRVSRHRDDD